MLNPTQREAPAFLRKGGEIGQLMRDYDWRSHALGEPQNWPQTLKTILGTILNSKFPMFLWWGAGHYCFYNDAYRPSLGENGKHPFILGMPGKEAWPENWDFIKPLIDGILDGGDGIFKEDMLVPIFRNGTMEDVYWTFSYNPVFDDLGTETGVLVTCAETTQRVRMVKELELSKRRFQHLIKEAPVGIIVLSGEEMKVEIVNEAYGRLIGKSVEELNGNRLFDVLPDSEAHFRPILDKVRLTGEALNLKAHPSKAVKNENGDTGYLNITYQPYQENGSSTKGVMVLCQDVTEQVYASRTTETALEQVRLSKEAALLGTFDMDMEKGTMVWDQRCRTLFGISHDDDVSYEKDFVEGLHPGDRDRITKIIDELFSDPAKKGNYDVEYRTVGVEDGKERWVRAKGKVYFDQQNIPLRFIGSVLDITEQKTDELRKNDFIGMVSHELKTPLTSSTAMIQLLLSKATAERDTFKENILLKANIQLKKMARMIKGFLDNSRLEAGKIIIERRDFDLIKLLDEAVEEAKVTLSTHKIQFIPCTSVIINADQDKISSVISNLLSNASKYSPKEKHIRLSCEVIGNEVIVKVTDQGIGIEQKDLSKLFDRFYRVENKETYHIAGFGIGLYLSAEIIKRHQGRIWAESKPGKGSTFSFALPVN